MTSGDMEQLEYQQRRCVRRLAIVGATMEFMAVIAIIVAVLWTRQGPNAAT